MTEFEENKVEDVISEVVPPARTQFNKNFCKYCGKELQPGAAFCSSCGKPQGSVPIQQPPIQMVQQPVVQPQVAYVYQQPQPVVAPNVSNTTTVVVEGSNSNSIGIAGFIIALLGLVFCWVPLVNLILWFLGLIFSLIGLFKSPRGMAIAGLVLSLIIIFIIISIWGTIFNALDTFFNK
jgi:hypothetical protein